MQSMTNLGCIILDDEKRNLLLLKNLLAENCPQLQVLAAETDPAKGMQLINELNPQLVFLDVEMPRFNGFQLLKKMEPLRFEVIFVTAYSHYAVEAFEHQAVGYITKPVNTEKLIAAVSAATERIEQKSVTKNI